MTCAGRPPAREPDVEKHMDVISRGIDVRYHRVDRGVGITLARNSATVQEKLRFHSCNLSARSKSANHALFALNAILTW